MQLIIRNELHLQAQFMWTTLSGHKESLIIKSHDECPFPPPATDCGNAAHLKTNSLFGHGFYRRRRRLCSH